MTIKTLLSHLVITGKNSSPANSLRRPHRSASRASGARTGHSYARTRSSFGVSKIEFLLHDGRFLRDRLGMCKYSGPPGRTPKAHKGRTG
eukprot:6556716-Pyramimonas_sp.AAC.1